jgi:hypothetical protein
MNTIVASDACSQRREVAIDRSRALAGAARLLADAITGQGEFVNWAAVPAADRDDLESSLGELRAALATSDLTLAELMNK